MFKISQRKNLWDIKYITYTSGMYLSVKTNEELRYYCAPQGFMKIAFQGKPNTKYTLSLLVDVDVGKARIFIEGVVYDLPNGKNVKSFTTDQLGYETIYIYGGPYMTATSGRLTEIQIEEGSVATDYENPNKISEIVFDTELFGFNNVYDTLVDGKLYKYWNREIKTTDSSGNFTLSGYMPSTTVIVINNSTGAVKILDVSSTVSTGWASTEVTVIYVSSSATVQELDYDGELTLNAAEINNIILPDCACAKITGTRKYLEG